MKDFALGQILEFALGSKELCADRGDQKLKRQNSEKVSNFSHDFKNINFCKWQLFNNSEYAFCNLTFSRRTRKFRIRSLFYSESPLRFPFADLFSTMYLFNASRIIADLVLCSSTRKSARNLACDSEIRSLICFSIFPITINTRKKERIRDTNA